MGTSDVVVLQDAANVRVFCCPFCFRELVRGNAFLAIISDTPPASVVAQRMECCRKQVVMPQLFMGTEEAQAALLLLKEKFKADASSPLLFPGEALGLQDFTRETYDSIPSSPNRQN